MLRGALTLRSQTSLPSCTTVPEQSRPSTAGKAGCRWGSNTELPYPHAIITSMALMLAAFTATTTSLGPGSRTCHADKLCGSAIQAIA